MIGIAHASLLFDSGVDPNVIEVFSQTDDGPVIAVGTDLTTACIWLENDVMPLKLQFTEFLYHVVVETDAT